MRQPIGPKLRFEILMRDDFTCQYCGAKAPDAALQVDHVIPVADGGPTSRLNLVTACQPCNAGKRTTEAFCHTIEQIQFAEIILDRVRRRFPKQFNAVEAYPIVRRIVSHTYKAAPEILDRCKGMALYWVDEPESYREYIDGCLDQILGSEDYDAREAERIASSR